MFPTRCSGWCRAASTCWTRPREPRSRSRASSGERSSHRSCTACTPTSARSTRSRPGSKQHGRPTSSAIDRIEDRSWLFRHVVARDVAYDSLPFAMRAHLHDRVGGFLESGGPSAIEHNLDLLAYHYWLGEDDDKKREYAVRAGIAAQSRYANDAAADYFQRALPLVPDEERAGVLRRLGKVLELRGGWADAEATYSEAIELVDAPRRRDGTGAGARRPCRDAAQARPIRRRPPATDPGQAGSSPTTTTTPGSAWSCTSRARSRRSRVSTTRPALPTRRAWRSANASRTERASAACSATSHWSPNAWAISKRRAR